MSILNIKDLCKNFGEVQVLRHVNMNVDAGEFVAVMGQSGSGKSTLLYCVSGMDNPSSGTICFQGNELTGMSEKKMQKLRLNNMGFVFQKTSFLKNLSVADNIVYPAFQLGKKDRRTIVKEMESLMEEMGIAEIVGRDISQVSGGQLQRAAICRAMINHPDILFGDELTGALNSSSTMEVMDILTRINQNGTTVLLVTHDSKVAMRADRVIYFEDGRIRDTLSLGKYDPSDILLRERSMKDWLERMKF